MTPSQAKRLVKSIVFRRKLLEGLPELEAELAGYLEVNDIRYLAGYEISSDNGRLDFRKLDPVEYKQSSACILMITGDRVV